MDKQLNHNAVLLIHPAGTSGKEGYDDIVRITNTLPPVGLACIAAWLEKAGFQATIVDCYVSGNAKERIKQILLSERPAFVGFSCITSTFPGAVELAGQVKSTLPETRTIVGGPHVSALKEKALENFSDLDYGIVGEGEKTLTELMDGGWRQPEKVSGLVYRKTDGLPAFTGLRKDLLKLDDLPFPAYEKLEGFPHAYTLPLFNYPRVPNAIAISSRGCLYSCSYCDRSVFGPTFRYNSADYIISLITHLNNRFGIRHITFYDDQFTLNRDRIEEFTRKLIESPLDITYNCVAHAQHLDKELLQKMKSSGCWMISVGIETGAQELLRAHRKHSQVDTLRERITIIKKAGIKVKGLAMMGLPGETPDTVRRSMDYIFSLPLDALSLSKFTPFPGSPVYSTVNDYGVFHEDWEKMDCMHFQFIPKGMTEEQLESLYQEFYRRYFTRPRTLWNYLTMIWYSPDSWRRFWCNALDYIRFARDHRRFQKN